MKAIRRTWPAALVTLLMPALTLLSPSSAEAKKKPKPPPAVWAITIPGCDSVALPNLCGREQTYYEDGGLEDGLGIGVTSGVEQGSPYSRFSFSIYRCEPGELCYDDPYAPEPLYLQGIELDAIDPVREVPCEFPGTDGVAYCRDLEPPLCMECFLNGPHPHWADDTGEDYRRFCFRLKVFNYDYATSPHPFTGKGYLSLEAYNTDDTLMPPDSDDHNIFGDNWEDPTDVYITRGPGQDSWTVNVTVSKPMLFREWYTSCARDPNPKGKCPSETKLPLDAQSTNDTIAFELTWTRIPSGD